MANQNSVFRGIDRIFQVLAVGVFLFGGLISYAANAARDGYTSTSLNSDGFFDIVPPQPFDSLGFFMVY